MKQIMTEYQWHASYCHDCGKAIAFSPDPLLVETVQPEIYCHSCAHSHAEAAGYMMPIGTGYSVVGLYEVDNFGIAEDNKRRFAKGWIPLCKHIQQHKVAKKKKDLTT